MNWLDVIVIVVQILLFVTSCFTINYVKQRANNLADILQNRRKTYESEKGKNLATKEDIAEITKSIEQVKSEISLKNQWEQEHISKREQRLINILYIAERIVMSYNCIYLYSHNGKNISKLFDTITELNAAALELTHEGNLLVAENSQMKNIEPARSLIKPLTEYASELSVLANNVANNLMVSEDFKKMAIDDITKAPSNSSDSMSKCLIFVENAKQLLNNHLLYKDSSDKAIQEYIKWLNSLYEDGSLLKYEMPDLSLVGDEKV